MKNTVNFFFYFWSVQKWIFFLEYWCFSRLEVNLKRFFLWILVFFLFLDEMGDINPVFVEVIKVSGYGDFNRGLNTMPNRGLLRSRFLLYFCLSLSLFCSLTFGANALSQTISTPLTTHTTTLIIHVYICRQYRFCWFCCCYGVTPLVLLL